MLKQPLRMDARIISFLLDTEKLDSRIEDACTLYDGARSAPELAFNFELQDMLLQIVQRERSFKGDKAFTQDDENEQYEIPFIQLSGPSGAAKAACQTSGSVFGAAAAACQARQAC